MFTLRLHRRYTSLTIYFHLFFLFFSHFVFVFNFQFGTLHIPAIKKKDSGNYTCNPSNSPTVTIVLHVINGKWDFIHRFYLRINRRKKRFYSGLQMSNSNIFTPSIKIKINKNKYTSIIIIGDSTCISFLSQSTCFSVFCFSDFISLFVCFFSPSKVRFVHHRPRKFDIT